jgi:hypothetical protein
MPASRLQTLETHKLPLIRGECLFTKGTHMKHVTHITLSGLGLALLAGLTGVVPPLRPLAAQQAARHHRAVAFDVAADCRTFVGGPNRGDVSYGSGKIFPAGTLPSGAATNDPIQPVNGVAPIGDWTTNGQNAFPFPPAVAQAYSLTPSFFATQFYVFDNGRNALTTATYAYFQGSSFLRGNSSITGGIGAFRGAAGDLTGGVNLGTNATGCPNFRANFNLVPGSVRGNSND